MRALPDQDRSVLAAACYSLAIWAEYNPSDSIRVTDQRQEFESCNRVPNLDRFIIARRSDATPIGAPGHAVYAIGMPGQHGRYNPGGHVPNANRCTPDTTWTPSNAGRREGAVTSRALGFRWVVPGMRDIRDESFPVRTECDVARIPNPDVSAQVGGAAR